MAGSVNVAALKQHFEHLFPGKWLQDQRDGKSLFTGIAEIDSVLGKGLARRRICEWIGTSSSGKSTLLRAAVANWCSSGFYVAYVDAQSRLVASDWAFVEQGNLGLSINSATKNSSTKLYIERRIEQPKKSGAFWVVRSNEKNDSDNDKKVLGRDNALWSAEQLIRSQVFDVVILDLGSSFSVSSRAYARLQRSLDRSKAALVIVRDDDLQEAAVKTIQSDWGCHTRLQFSWTTPVHCRYGLFGIASMSPTINGCVSRDGMSQNVEVTVSAHESNRLFTHTQIPDRRTTKTKPRSQK